MRDLLQPKLYYLTDSIVVVISMVVSWWVKKTTDATFLMSAYQSYILILLGIIPLYIFLYYTFDLHTSKRGQRFNNEFLKIIEANFIGFILILGFLFLLKLHVISRVIVLQFVFLNTLFSVIFRYSMRRVLMSIRRKGYNLKNVLVIGAGSLGREFMKKLKEHQEYGYYIVGFLDDNPKKIGTRVGNSKVLGNIGTLECQLSNGSIEEVIIALPFAAHKKIASLIEICEKQGIKTMLIPDYYKIIPATKPKVIEFDDMPLILTRDIPLDMFLNRLVKRGFDIIVSSVLIILFSPILLLVAVGVKISSLGPVLFKQKRVGLNRALFDMYKFRSMRVSSDEIACTTWTTECDPRRTGFGEFIRRISLDELPQLFNVLKGDMSIIGPRPERPHFVEKFKEEIPRYMVKHQVKPGITGWAQVNGWRGDTSIEERIKCDIYYIENWSLVFDIRILYLTAIKGIVNRNAY